MRDRPGSTDAGQEGRDRRVRELLEAALCVLARVDDPQHEEDGHEAGEHYSL
jgi:hypothetical protein